MPPSAVLPAAPPVEESRPACLPWRARFFRSGAGPTAVYAVVAWVYLLGFPHGLPLPNLDQSWSSIVTLAGAEHWAFGREIMLNYGPWSHLGTGLFYAPLFTTNYLFQIVSKALLVALICRVGRALPPAGRGLFFAANLLAGFLEWETIHLLAAVYTGWLLSEDRTRAGRVVGYAGVVLVAASGLMKTFYLVFGLGVFGCVLARHVLRGHGREGGLPLAAFLACFGLDWQLAGQRFGDLPAYLHGAMELTGGHSRAMGYDASPAVFWMSFAILAWTGGLGLILVVRGVRGGGGAAALPLAALFAGSLFMAWKQGITRADAFHLSGYYCFMAVSVTALPLFFGDGRRLAPAWYYAGVAGVWAVIIAATAVERPSEGAYLLHELPTRPVQNLRVLFHPAAERARLDAEVARLRLTCALPKTRAAVGRARIDCFGTAQGLIPLNDLNYAPVPTLQGFLAYTPYLVELNARCYAPDRAPEFVLFQGGSIDDRWRSLDGAVQLRELLQNYRPVLAEYTLLLLRRKPAAECVPPRPVLQQHGELPLNTSLDLPADGADWCELEVRRTFLGRLINFFYHEPFLTIEATTVSGRHGRWSLPPVMAQGGFLLRQGPRSRDDVDQLFAGRPVRDPVKSIRLGGGALLSWAIQPRVTYRFYHLDAAPTASKL